MYGHRDAINVILLNFSTFVPFPFFQKQIDGQQQQQRVEGLIFCSEEADRTVKG